MEMGMDGDGEPAPADSLAKARRKDEGGKEKKWFGAQSAPS
jgi:hypothetical protein